MGIRLVKFKFHGSLFSQGYMGHMLTADTLHLRISRQHYESPSNEEIAALKHYNCTQALI